MSASDTKASFSSFKDRIGSKVGPFEENAGESRISAFARAVGAKQEKNEAPPTFATVCRRGEFALLQELGVPLSRILHGEQEYLYRGEILPGDVLHYQTSLTYVAEKQGSKGSMHFLTFESPIEARGSSGRREVATAKTIIVVR